MSGTRPSSPRLAYYLGDVVIIRACQPASAGHEVLSHRTKWRSATAQVRLAGDSSKGRRPSQLHWWLGPRRRTIMHAAWPTRHCGTTRAIMAHRVYPTSNPHCFPNVFCSTVQEPSDHPTNPSFSTSWGMWVPHRLQLRLYSVDGATRGSWQCGLGKVLVTSWVAAGTAGGALWPLPGEQRACPQRDW